MLGQVKRKTSTLSFFSKDSFFSIETYFTESPEGVKCTGKMGFTAPGPARDLTTGEERDNQFLKWEWDFFRFTVFNYII